MIRIEEINDVSRLTVDRIEWNSLVLSSRDCSPFQTYEWITTYIKYYLHSKDIILLFAYDDNRLVGIAPLLKFEYTRLKLFRLKKIVFLGEIFSEYCDFIVHDGYAQKVIPVFIDYVFSEYAGVNRIDLRDIFPDSETNHTLLELSQYNPYQIKGEKYLFIKTSDAKEKYYNQFSKKTLQTLKRKSDKLKNLDTKYLFADTGNAENIQKLALFNRQRISQKNETSFFDSDTNLSFLVKAAEELNKSKICHLCSCIAGDDYISLYLCFLFRNKLYFFISGFNKKYEDFSPGAVHLKEIIDYCFETNIHEFDFMRGEDDYKFRFHPETRHPLRILLMKKSRLSILRKAIFIFYQFIKKSL